MKWLGPPPSPVPRYRIVTTHRHGCRQGQRFIETFDHHAPATIDLRVYVDGMTDPPKHEDVRRFRRLEDFPPWVAWMRQTKDELARRFGHKVFALADAATESDDVEWLILVDSDVEWIDTVDLSFLDSSKVVAYLGRPWFRYSECGFVAYHVAMPEAREIIVEMLGLYLDADPASLQWGHDSAIFDRARKLHSTPDQWQDMTGHLDPTAIEQKGLHVWPASPLASVAVHHKGPARKYEAYG